MLFGVITDRYCSLFISIIVGDNTNDKGECARNSHLGL